MRGLNVKKEKKNTFKATEGNYFERNTFDLVFPLLALSCVIKKHYSE